MDDIQGRACDWRTTIAAKSIPAKPNLMKESIRRSQLSVHLTETETGQDHILSKIKRVICHEVEMLNIELFFISEM